MRIKTTWLAMGAEDRLKTLADELSKTTDQAVKVEYGEIFLVFPDETSEDARVFLEAANKCMPSYPDIQVRLKRKGNPTKAEIREFPLVRLGFADGTKYLSKGCLEKYPQCINCGVVEAVLAKRGEVSLRQNLTLEVIAEVAGVFVVSQALWSDMSPFLSELGRVPVQGNTERMAFIPIYNLGPLVGEVDLSEPCQACGYVKIKRNDNLLPTFRASTAKGHSILKCVEHFASSLFVTQEVLAIFKKHIPDLKPWPCMLIED